jgi:hypothetical protein
LANKPVAPAHLVFIGVVTRAQSNNGEIFVKPQNGFELHELHDVLIESPADNEVMAYDSASGLWKNQTAAEAGLATSTHTHAISDVTSLQTALDAKLTNSDSGWLTSGIITAASGWSIVSYSIRKLNGIVNGVLSVTRTGSAISVPATGNITNTVVATLASDWYASGVQSGMVLTNGTGPLIGGVVSSTGGITITAATSGATIATNDTFSFTIMEMV